MILKIGDFRIVPRPRYAIDEEEFRVNLNDAGGSNSASGCASGSGEGDCVSPVKNREIIFTIRCLGHGDLRAADISYRALENFLAELCRSNQQDYYRQVDNEDPLIYPIASGYVQPVDIELEYSCERVKSGEVHLFTAETDETSDTATFNYNINRAL